MEVMRQTDLAFSEWSSYRDGVVQVLNTQRGRLNCTALVQGAVAETCHDRAARSGWGRVVSMNDVGGNSCLNGHMHSVSPNGAFHPDTDQFPMVVGWVWTGKCAVPPATV